MADISILARLINGVVRNVDMSANTLVTTSIKVGGDVSNTELTKAILDNLIHLQNGTDFSNGTNSHTHDGRYFQESELSSSTSSSGSDLIGDDNTYSNFVPAAATVKGALSGIDLALATAGGTSFSDVDFEVYDNVTPSKKLKLELAGLSASTTRILSMPDADVNLGALNDSNIAALAGIAYSKLNLTSSIVDADIAALAGISYSKLALSNSITDSDVSTLAAISLNKLAVLAADKALVSDGSGYISAAFTTATEIGYLSGVTSAVQTQLNAKAEDSTVIKKDGSVAFTSDQSMGGNKLTNVANGSSPNDAINKSQLDAYASGVLWLNPIQDPDLIDDSLNTPPGSPVVGNVYIVGASPTGAWSGLSGRAVFWSGSTWVDLLGRAVAIGDRFGVSMESTTAGAGGLAGQDNKIAQITNATPGAITYSFTSPVTPQAVYVSNDISTHFGHSYTYNGTAWIEFGGPGATNAGVGLAWDGNTLNVKLGAGIAELPTDEVGVDVHSDGGLMTTVDNSASSTATGAQLAIKLDGSTLAKSSSGLKVASGGISNNEINSSAAIAYSKLALSGSIVNADIASGAAIAYSKLSLSGSIVNADISASAAIDYSKLSLANSIVNADISASAAIAYSKLSLSNSIVNADIASGAAIAYSKLSLTNSIVLGDLTSNSVDENKLTTSVAGNGLTGGGGSALAVGAGNGVQVNANDVEVVHSPAVKKTFVAGESFASDTTYAVRIALTGETAGRVYKADYDASVSDKFYAIGIIEGFGASAKSAGDPVSVVLMGTVSLGSNDSAFASGEIGQAVHLKGSGTWDAVSQITYATDQASYRVGMVQETNKILVSGMQLLGIN